MRVPVIVPRVSRRGCGNTPCSRLPYCQGGRRGPGDRDILDAIGDVAAPVLPERPAKPGISPCKVQHPDKSIHRTIAAPHTECPGGLFLYLNVQIHRVLADLLRYDLDVFEVIEIVQTLKTPFEGRGVQVVQFIQPYLPPYHLISRFFISSDIDPPYLYLLPFFNDEGDVDLPGGLIRSDIRDNIGKGIAFFTVHVYDRRQVLTQHLTAEEHVSLYLDPLSYLVYSKEVVILEIDILYLELSSFYNVEIDPHPFTALQDLNLRPAHLDLNISPVQVIVPYPVRITLGLDLLVDPRSRKP